ncbi:energy-coupling factor ABC transporter permease [Fusibacter sp. JL298sf-3]
MSHIHLPDGMIPFPIWLSAFLLTALLLGVSIRKMQQKDLRRILPFTGIAAALMLLGMSVPILIIPVHLSLAVFTGILLGPYMGFVVAFVVMTILGLFGHGGVTLIGLNTLIMGLEMTLGWFVFYRLKTQKRFVKAFVATVVALTFSMSAMITVVGSAVGFSYVMPHDHAHEEEVDHDHAHEEEVDHDHAHEDEVDHDHAHEDEADHDHAHEDEADHDHAHEDEADHDHAHEDEADHDHAHEGDFENAVENVTYLSFSGLAALLVILGIGLILEATATGLLINYFGKIRPELLEKE